MFNFKKKKITFDVSRDFNNVISFAKNHCDWVSSQEEKIIILDSVLQLLRNDIQYDLLSKIIYRGSKSVPYDGFLRGKVLDEFGEPVPSDLKAIKSIDLAKDCVIAVPWKDVSWKRTMINIFKNPFEFQSNNHDAYYHSFMDITYVYNGRHSISAGITHRKGTINAKVVDIEVIFPHIYCDHEAIYSTYTNQIINKIFDFRLGLIFEIAKMKYNLINNTERVETK